MSVMPSIAGGGRYRDIALIVTLALGQATAAAVAAFSTRDVFAAFRDGRVEMPMLALALIAVAGIAIAALRYRERVVAERVGQHYAAALRVTLFRHLAHVSSREIARRRSGGLSLRFVGDLAAVRGWVSLGFARLVSSMIVLPLAALALFLLNPHLGLVAAAPFAIGIVLMVIAAPRLDPAHQRLRSRRARLAADMSERAPHAPELRLLGRIQTETRHIEKRTEKLVSAALERARGAALLRAVPDAVSGVAAAAVLYAALSGGASGAEAAGALAAVGLMIQPMRDLAGVWDRHRAWRVAREKCTNLLSVPRLPRGPPDRPQDQDAEQEAAGRELVFKAAAGGGLSPMTIVAAPGRKIAIIGANGAGKSTLLSLAAGLEKPDQGAILLGGRETMTLSTVERRRLITFIGPRSPILAGSLRRALTMGINRGHDDTAVAACAEAFGLGHVIERLGGLSGRIAEAGRNLSAGEIRRVLLTRAALSNASLMLLDEPDDALDRDGPALVERLVFATGATTLLVTHNHALAARLDEVWLMDAGRLVAAGSPETILRQCAPRAGAQAA